MNQNSELREMEHIIEEEMKKQSRDVLEVRYLNQDNAKFERTKGGFVSLKYNEKEYKRVGIYYTFPFTGPEVFISIREENDKKREIGMIEDLEKEFSDDQVLMLKEQLKLRYFTPIIEKIIDIKEEYGFAYFQAITNFGKTKFTIHMNGGGVVSLSESRILITDVDGNRYEIPNINQLTSKELKKLDLYI